MAFFEILTTNTKVQMASCTTLLLKALYMMLSSYGGCKIAVKEMARHWFYNSAKFKSDMINLKMYSLVKIVTHNTLCNMVEAANNSMMYRTYFLRAELST